MLGVQRRQFFRIEMRRRAADLVEGEFAAPAHPATGAVRWDRRCRSWPDSDATASGSMPSSRSDSQRQRAQPLGQRLAARADQQRKMRESGHGRAQRLEDFDLRRGVGDMVFAAHDMADSEIDVVGDRRQACRERRRPRAPARDRTGSRCRSPPPAHQIAPATFWRDSLKRQCGLRPSASSSARCSSVSFERGAVIDRRLAMRDLALARWRSSSAAVS